MQLVIRREEVSLTFTQIFSILKGNTFSKNFFEGFAHERGLVRLVIGGEGVSLTFTQIFSILKINDFSK